MTQIEHITAPLELSEVKRQKYLAEIERATNEDATKYRHYFIASPQGIYDVTQNGDVSCAWFASNVLNRFDLIDRAHPTVASTVNDMYRSGWEEIDPIDIVPGAVVRWPVGESGNAHLGFYIGSDEYVSNNYVVRSPVKHGEKLLDGRMPENVYALEALRMYRAAVSDE